jgi:hypothetical protein
MGGWIKLSASNAHRWSVSTGETQEQTIVSTFGAAVQTFEKSCKIGPEERGGDACKEGEYDGKMGRGEMGFMKKKELSQLALLFADCREMQYKGLGAQGWDVPNRYEMGRIYRWLSGRTCIT